MYNINGVFVLLLVFVGFYTSTRAQSTNTSESYKKNQEKARKLIYKYPDSTKIFANRALLSAKNNDERAEVYCVLGRMARTQEWNNSAIHYYKQSLKLYTKEAKKNKIRLAMITPYSRQKKYLTALELARWVTHYAKQQQDLKNLRKGYSYLGNVFYNLSQQDTLSIRLIDSSLHYHRKSITLRKKHAPKTLAMAYYNSSFAYEAISPDSAIYYTQLALQQPELKNYYKVLFNIRLAQVYYKQGKFQEGRSYLSKVQKIPCNDLNLQNLYWFYKAMIALHQQSISEARQSFNKYDSVVGLLCSKAQNTVDRKDLMGMLEEDYQEAYNAAMKMYKSTQKEAYLGLINQYKSKKQKASKTLSKTHLLIAKQDSILLSKADSNTATDTPSPQLERLLRKEQTQREIYWGVMFGLIVLGVIGWWYRTKNAKKTTETIVEPTPQLIIQNQKLNTQLLNTLATENKFEEILSLLETNLGNKVTEKYKQYLPSDVSLNAKEKVYVVLLSEGFSQWEIGQMLNQHKRNIIEWDKKIKQKTSRV